MAAKFFKIKRYRILNPNDLFNACIQAATTKGFRLVNKNDAEFTVVFSAGISWLSWGEIITLRIQKLETQLELEVKSECKLKTTIVDWGKNRKNVEGIFSVLNEKIH